MPPVVIYTAARCPYCEMARNLLDTRGIGYEQIDVTGKPNLRSEMSNRAGGRSTVPQIWIGDRHVGGCDDLYALERSGGLDQL
jgi:glutaredoxin 3